MNALLEKDETEIFAMAKKIQTFTDDKGRIEKGREFRQVIQSMNYSISEDTEKELMVLLEKGEKVIHNLGIELQNTRASKREAQEAYKRATQQCKDYDTQLIVTLKDALNREFYSVMGNLRNEYQDYIVSVLQENFPEDIEFQEFQATIAEMPSVQEMVDANVKIETKTVIVDSYEVSDSVWYKPWTWFSSHTEYVRETQKTEYVDLTPIAETLTTNLRTVSTKNIDGFREDATTNVGVAKANVLATMDSIDKKVEAIQAKLLVAIQDKTKMEARRQENQIKMDWYNEFCKELQEILAV